MVTNLVGTDNMRIEIGTAVGFAKHDTLMLCSDAVTDNLSTDQIVELIRCEPLRQCLINLEQSCVAAMEEPSGRKDDLSVILMRPGIG